MNCTFKVPFTNGQLTHNVIFTDFEVSKLLTLSNMLSVIGKSDMTTSIPINIEVLPESVELIKLIFAENSYESNIVKPIIYSFLEGKEPTNKLNTMYSLLIFIDFMDIDSRLEDIIYSVSSEYLITTT
tara:strand:+ start:444 stop:827 length:384 start_codon:yes stop_codon:yes gene_type:complete